MMKQALLCGVALANAPMLPFILSGASYGVLGADLQARELAIIAEESRVGNRSRRR